MRLHCDRLCLRLRPEPWSFVVCGVSGILRVGEFAGRRSFLAVANFCSRVDSLELHGRTAVEVDVVLCDVSVLFLEFPRLVVEGFGLFVFVPERETQTYCRRIIMASSIARYHQFSIQPRILHTKTEQSIHQKHKQGVKDKFAKKILHK